MQTEHTDGNCLQACIASLLGMQLSDVPNFVEYDEYWFIKMQEWASELGFSVLCIDSYPPPDVYAILCGPSPRGDFSHAVVVGPGNSLVHDPHPSGEGLADGDRWCYLFVPREPRYAIVKDKSPVDIKILLRT